MSLTSVTQQLVTNWTDSSDQSSWRTWIWRWGEGGSYFCNIQLFTRALTTSTSFNSVLASHSGQSANSGCQDQTTVWGKGEEGWPTQTSGADLVLSQQHGTGGAAYEGRGGGSLHGCTAGEHKMEWMLDHEEWDLEWNENWPPWNRMRLTSMEWEWNEIDYYGMGMEWLTSMEWRSTSIEWNGIRLRATEDW